MCITSFSLAYQTLYSAIFEPRTDKVWVPLHRAGVYSISQRHPLDGWMWDQVVMTLNSGFTHAFDWAANYSTHLLFMIYVINSIQGDSISSDHCCSSSFTFVSPLSLTTSNVSKLSASLPVNWHASHKIVILEYVIIILFRTKITTHLERINVVHQYVNVPLRQTTFRK